MGGKLPSRILLVLLTLVLGSLVFASSSLAATFSVNTTNDLADNNIGNGVCQTASANCSLRAAVQESNSTAGADTVNFSGAFDGTLATSTIALGSTISVTNPIVIDGSGCTDSGNPKPCVGIDMSSPGQTFSISASNSTFRGLSITSSFSGFNFASGASSNAVEGNWIGLNLNKNTDGNEEGVGVEEGAGNITIGGDTPAERNVFSGDTRGVKLVGDNNTVSGNYFGVAPDGNFQAQSQLFNIQVGDGVTAAFVPNNNTIGGPDNGTPGVCDGKCNFIAGGGTGIRIEDGFMTEVDNTKIIGNFIGIGPNGEDWGINATAILNAQADGTVIGGASVDDRNFIAGNNIEGVDVQSGAENLLIQNNFFSLNPAGTSAVPNTYNDIRIGSFGSNQIKDNRFGGSTLGPIQGSIGGSPNNLTITSNIFGKAVGGGALPLPSSAISLTAANSNTIGGANQADENLFANTGDSAIKIQNDGSDNNSIQRNKSESSKGLYIDLAPPFGLGNSASGPNSGIQAPSISTLSDTSLTGTGADVVASVDAYKWTSQSVQFIGTGNANVNGNFSINFTQLQPTDCVAVLQRNFGDTSELGQPKLVSGGNCDSAEPSTTIDSGPNQNATINNNQPSFTFSSNDGSATFECSYDLSGFGPCSGVGSHQATLGDGQHTFNVRAIDTSGNIDTSPASRTFTIDTGGPPDSDGDGVPDSSDSCPNNINSGLDNDSDGIDNICDPTPGGGGGGGDSTPPQTTIIKGPGKATKNGAKTKDTTPKFKFAANEASTFKCAIDKGSYKACNSPYTTKKLKLGKRQFKVVATDAAGNADLTPAVRKFTVIK